jgi:hypothetical protein
MQALPAWCEQVLLLCQLGVSRCCCSCQLCSVVLKYCLAESLSQHAGLPAQG